MVSNVRSAPWMIIGANDSHFISSFRHCHHDSVPSPIAHDGAVGRVVVLATGLALADGRHPAPDLVAVGFMAVAAGAKHAKLLWLTLPIGFRIVWLVALWAWAIFVCAAFSACI